MKRVFKEFDKSLYSIDIMLYSIMSFMGFFLLNSEISAEVEIYQYTISYFFIFALKTYSKRCTAPGIPFKLNE